MSDECNQYQTDLSAWLDGELDDGATRALFLHLSGCDICLSFCRSSISVEREFLKVGRVGGSDVLDARVASIGRTSIRSNDRSPDSGKDHGRMMSQDRMQFPYAIAAIIALFALTVGFILGTFGPLSGSAANGRDPQVIYVSMLPTLTIVGHGTDYIRKGQ
jgi:hypothetical protein